MICAGFRDKEDPPAACQVSSKTVGRHSGGEASSFHLKDVYPSSFSSLSGRLWRATAVPTGPGPLGGARGGELRANRLHRGEQAQRVYPHRCLHPLDRGHADQGLLPALICWPRATNTRLVIVFPLQQRSSAFLVCAITVLELTICAIKNIQNQKSFNNYHFYSFLFKCRFTEVHNKHFELYSDFSY